MSVQATSQKRHLMLHFPERASRLSFKTGSRYSNGCHEPALYLLINLRKGAVKESRIRTNRERVGKPLGIGCAGQEHKKLIA